MAEAARGAGRRRVGLGRRPARVAGAYVVLVGGEPACTSSAAAGSADARRRGDARLGPALAALVEQFARGGAIKRLALEKVDGEPAMSSPLAPVLIELGFRRGRGG